ncbi:MAG: helix-turn-helix transcriptional regulator [Kineosporiaceae bacterium]
MQGPAGVLAVAALADGGRRELYAFARRQDRPITRDEAAAHLGISRKLAAFHLDKLVAAGLLVTQPGLPPGRGRIGRPPKTYRPSDAEIEVSVPARRYDLAAQILLDAVITADATGSRAVDAALRSARRYGRGLGEAARSRVRGGPIGPERTLSLVERVAGETGFEPVRPQPRLLRLRNCPFSRLAESSRELVCGMNLELLRGVVDGIGGSVAVELAPEAGACCVQLRA